MRQQQQRRYLMCPPTYFEVAYSINHWMDPGKPVDTALAVAQWERLRQLHVSLGHTVHELTPRPGLPDMVFTANGATVLNGRALVARFRHAERAGESSWYLDWFRSHGWPVTSSRHINEGEGDFLAAGRYILGGSGYRTEPAAHTEAQEFFGRPVIGLTLVDPRFYHLDTALTVLDDDEIAYFPGAFSPRSRTLLQTLFPDAIQASETDAEAFGLNAVSDGRFVILSQTATSLAAKLSERGYEPIGVDLSELRKAGGGAKCCTLQLQV
jgi:N-dimethylarginine dimethylaminohydrolase